MGPQSSGTVEIRAFRGTRRTSVYRDHVLAAAVFGRILAVGRGQRLGVLAGLGAGGPHQLDKRRSRQLASEVESLRRSADLLDLDDHLAAISEVARWCARASGPAWLTVTYLS